jgi:hypothetical protein
MLALVGQGVRVDGAPEERLILRTLPRALWPYLPSLRRATP